MANDANLWSSHQTAPAVHPLLDVIIVIFHTIYFFTAILRLGCVVSLRLMTTKNSRYNTLTTYSVCIYCHYFMLSQNKSEQTAPNKNNGTLLKSQQSGLMETLQDLLRKKRFRTKHNQLSLLDKYVRLQRILANSINRIVSHDSSRRLWNMKVKQNNGWMLVLRQLQREVSE